MRLGFAAVDRRDYNAAFASLGRGCDMDSAASCAQLGILYQDGKGVVADGGKAAEIYNKACILGDAMGCNNVGVLFANGERVEKNLHRAIRAYRRACELDSAEGCHSMG